MFSFLSRHLGFLIPYCVRCGIEESVKSDMELKHQYDSIDAYLKSSRKVRISVKGDGHCLPRAVFRGAKHLHLIPHSITYYSALLKATVDSIICDLSKYLGFITETQDSALQALNSYLVDKKYTLESNIIDNQTCCEIKVHYQDRDGSFDTHLLSPDSCKRGVIELAFLKSHYDLVIKRIVKKEPTMANDPMVTFARATFTESVQSDDYAASFTDTAMTNDPTLSFAHDSDSESSEIGDMSHCDARTEEHMTPDPFIKKPGLQIRRSDGKTMVNDSVI